MKRIYFKHRLKEFLPELIMDLIDNEVILAGGVFRAYLNGEKIQDYDVFFLNKDKIEKVKNKLLNKKFKIIFQCPQGNFTSLRKKNIKIQLITEKIFNNIEEILDSFDFTITQFATEGYNLFTTKQALKDTRNKKIRFNKITYPSATLGRFYKYIKKGYHLDQIAKNDFINRVVNNQQDFLDLNRVYID